MKQIVTTGVILTRIDYGEADRIITFLTPDHGKLRLMAKGVRRIKSKLAGGVELFSVSNITFISGRGEVGTLVSTRLQTHYRHITEDYDRTMAGYDLIKQLHKATEDNTEEQYFYLLQLCFDALNTKTTSLDLIRAWFLAQLIKLSGHSPQLDVDTGGAALDASKKYRMDYDSFALSPHHSGTLKADNIKFFRLLLSDNQPAALQRITGADQQAKKLQPILKTIWQSTVDR